MSNRHPYEVVTVSGMEAEAAWRQLRARGKGSPLIIGGDDELDYFGHLVSADRANEVRWNADEILDAAAALRWPEDLTERFRERSGDDGYDEVTIGDWPAQMQKPVGLTIAADIVTGVPLERVHILLVPTPTNHEIPALLPWGGWNDCPYPEYHVAALRSWNERYGAELVAVNRDTMNVTVASRPQSREEALALAREHFEFCTDIVFQGTETLSALAASLMASDWWFFWWD